VTRRRILAAVVIAAVAAIVIAGALVGESHRPVRASRARVAAARPTTTTTPHTTTTTAPPSTTTTTAPAIPTKQAFVTRFAVHLLSFDYTDPSAALDYVESRATKAAISEMAVHIPLEPGQGQSSVVAQQVRSEATVQNAIWRGDNVYLLVAVSSVSSQNIEPVTSHVEVEMTVAPGGPHGYLVTYFRFIAGY